MGGRAALRAGRLRLLWPLALLAFVPLAAVRTGVEQPNPCSAVPPGQCAAFQRAVLSVRSSNGIPALGYRGRGFYGYDEGRGDVQVFSYERFGPFGLPAGWVCARWKMGTTEFPRVEACAPGTGHFILRSPFGG